ncbi:tripartite tricarboxylate transporter TctB family protein [Agrobacterium radiobacter]|uniref:tripartite tricarboxylate transporter TctB family protein n=1 Tax=Agrobacterium radiobacter TaxID=362 RepID=UPI003CF67ABB
MAEHKNGSKLTANILSGVFFLVAAAGLYYGARPLSMGTNFQPGPGYMPTVIAALMFALGIALLLQDLLGKTPSEAWAAPKMRPFLAVAGIAGFALLIEPLGFIAAAFVLILLACIAYGRIRPVEVLLLSAVLILACILIFVVGLGQRIPLLP